MTSNENNQVTNQWQRDFPIRASAEADVSRRDFVKFLLLISSAFTLGQYWILLQAIRRPSDTFPKLEIAKTDALQINQTLSFYYPTAKDPCLLVRLNETQFVAYDRRCTHLACPVIANPEEGHLHCPCHDGEFELMSGSPVSGPPQRPLKRIVLEIHDNLIFAVGVENRAV